MQKHKNVLDSPADDADDYTLALDDGEEGTT
jgi:hypothetical protein